MRVGADSPTGCLGELVRERGVFTLEELVHQFTDAPPRLYGLRDRGRLVEGAWADVVVFDAERIDAAPLQTVRDLPGGAARLTTRSVGVEHVVVNGDEIVSEGELTGRLPGRLLRSGR